ncbi:tetratricopeptide repeat protein [Kaarinaea lacus]
MTSIVKKEPNRAKQDFEALTVIMSVALVVAILSLISNLSTNLQPGISSGSAVQGYTMPAHLRSKQPMTAHTPESGPKQAFREAFNEPQSEQEKRVNERFQQAIGLLHAKRYDYAITALDAVLEMVPDMPEAYVNMGYAFIGLKEYGPARGAFEKALELKVDQVNAYYGLAIAFEGLEDYEGALGAMRSYIHLSPPDDPFLAKARSALWEWEGQLGRIQGVEPAPEGTEGETIKAPYKWTDEHKSP